MKRIALVLGIVMCAARLASASDLFSYTATGSPGGSPDGVDQNNNSLTVWTLALTPGGTNQNNDAGSDGEGVYFGNPDGGGGIPGGNAWQEYSYQNDGTGLGGSVDATNTFSGGALAVGQTVSINFVMRATDPTASGRPPGTVGVSLLNGTNVAVEFFIFGGGPGYYEYNDATQTNAKAGTMGYQYQAWFNVAFTVTGPNTYTAHCGSDIWSGTFNGSLTGIDVFNHAGGNGSDVGFNNLTIAPELSIGNISPDDTVALFNATNKLTFTATSPASPINANGVQLVLNGVDISSHLIITGAGSDNISAAYTNLALNMNYAGTITVSNTAGGTISSPVRFDTFSASYFTWEGEDFDFSGGQFIDNPVVSTNNVNSYYNTVGVSNIDEYVPNYANTQPHGWRTNDLVATDVSGDTARPQFITAGVADYSVGFFNPGNWLDYTKTFPAGTYNLYARLANGNGGLANATLAQVTQGHGTTTQTTNILGIFQFTSRGWSSYDFIPLTDGQGNTVAVQLNGQETLQLTSGPLGGGVNVNFFMLAPGSNTPPAIVNVYPNGAQPFQATNQLTFGVSSSISTVNHANVHVRLNGSDVSSQVTYSGPSTNLQASLSLPNQGYYALTVTATDAAGNSNTFTGTFDNFTQSNLMIEADEYDFNGGQFIPDPISESATNYGGQGSYYTWPNFDPNNLNFAVEGIDYTTANTNTGETFLFRYDDAVGTQITSDFLRNKFINTGQVSSLGEPLGATNMDFNVGWWNPGTWLNYTRVFPTNNYYVYGRLAGGVPYTGTTLSQVTAGQGTDTQTTQVLGSFSDPSANGFQSWHWVPLVNNGTNVIVTLGGTNTIQATAGPGAAAGNVNAHFYMFVPAVSGPLVFSVGESVSGNTISITVPTLNGHSYTVLYSPSLSPANWQTLTSFGGDGTVHTATDSATGAQRFYKVMAQ